MGISASFPIFPREYLDGDAYMEQVPAEGYPMDMEATMPTETRIGSKKEDEFRKWQEASSGEVIPFGIEDFILGPPAARGTAEVADAAARGAKYIPGAYKIYKVLPEVKARADRAQRFNYLFPGETSDNWKNAFRGFQGTIDEQLLGIKPKRTSANYREVPEINKKTEGGIPAAGIHVSSPVEFPNIPAEIALKEDAPKWFKDSAKRHEYNHKFWSDKYKDVDEAWDLLPPTKQPKEYVLKDAEYFGKPTEVNARAREMQYILNKIKDRNPRDIATMGDQEYATYLKHLRDLRDQTEPFAADFIKRFPDEMGEYLYKGYDYLDNLPENYQMLLRRM